MSEQKRLIALAVLMLAIISVFAASGCRRAEADPLEVTYYYLPG